ncbi:hypothetical protein ETB97_011218 [Aspergillus alliaceus]|uniref:Uncharacterized protein n=1 Tax=Petromyces alliaceus TaxID=209559 RepID=A0A8H6ABD3_PETAA|nr:hypothetical protein ETB97_011218 [Aspergillus burnettii]
MARRYQIDELLWLRSSPLVTKPTNLPPVEEWMGPIPDPTTQRKSTGPRDPSNPNETTPRRSSIFESRHISRNSNSEDIILGPPKTAFASASRVPGKGSIDATERPSRQPDSDDTKNDRLNFRGKFFKDREAGDNNFDRRDGKTDPFTPRRGDRDDWNAGRPRRPFGQDENERKPRRNGEFDRWESRDFNRDRDQQTPNFERGARDKDSRFFPRKDGQPGRARHEGSWFRDESNQDGPDGEEEKTPIRSRDWRRDRHGADRDWTRGAKFEQEPEWLDSTDKDEPRRVHTQEDFERWKERMKAGSSQAHVEEKKETSAEPTPIPTQKPEPRPTDGEIFSSNGAPFQSDTAMERFFGLLVEQKPPQETSTSSPLEATVVSQATPKENIPPKSFKSSRFAGLFSPPPGSPAKESDFQIGNMSPTVLPSTTDADQEGFQRILQMLGGSKSRNATPHNDTAQPNRPPSLPQIDSIQSAISSPSREQIKRPDPMLMQDSSIRSAGPAVDPQAREREHLLRLMQQVRVTPVTNQVQGNHGLPQSAGAAPGMMHMPEMLPPPPGLASAPKVPNFIDDPAIANMQRADHDQLRRRPANGPPMGYFEDMPFPQGRQVPITPGGSRAPQGQGLPGMGVQRPPGFEHLPPPGWAGHQLPPQQGGGPGPLAPPPGIPTPTRGVNPNFMSNMMPMHGNVPPLVERQPFPRGAGGSGSAGFPPPPMMPPPGYINGPPPSGFPPMPPNAEALMGLGHGGQGPFDGNPGPQGPPPSSRHLLDMFGQVGAGDARGGMLGDMMDEVDFELCLDIDQYVRGFSSIAIRAKAPDEGIPPCPILTSKNKTQVPTPRREPKWQSTQSTTDTARQDSTTKPNPKVRRHEDLEGGTEIDNDPVNPERGHKKLKTTEKPESDLPNDEGMYQYPHASPEAKHTATTHHDQNMGSESDTEPDTRSSVTGANVSTEVDEGAMDIETETDVEVHTDDIHNRPSSTYIVHPSHLFPIYEDTDNSHLENHSILTSRFTTYSSPDEDKENSTEDEYEQLPRQRVSANPRMWARPPTDRFFAGDFGSGYQVLDGPRDGYHMEETDTEVEDGSVSDDGHFDVDVRGVEMEDLRESFHALSAFFHPLTFHLPSQLPSPRSSEAEGRVGGAQRRCLRPRPVVYFE